MPFAVYLATLAFAMAVFADDPESEPADRQSAPATGQISFVRDVQPIFTARCIACHGAKKQASAFRLDVSDSAFKGGEIGRAIVPGKSDESPLIDYVSGVDDSIRMPPSGDRLTAEEIGVLRSWIDEGADWPASASAKLVDPLDHWAYKPLTKPSMPARDASEWARTPIDAFILATLEENGLSPSEAADKRTLLRRVTFDLTGLPPTAEESAAFLASSLPTAYAEVVDRLLASPRYGERWARHWMDVVHFAETHGHDQDRPRPDAWPYRDYLIRSFNADKAYGRFLQEQLAGDVLFPNDPWAIVATGFLATGPWDESSLQSIQEDSLDRDIARYLDRDDIVTTVMSTFASTTVHCARCHDHKFDPISQNEYYGLQAVFSGIDKAARPYDADSTVLVRRAELNERKTRLPTRVAGEDPALLEQAVQEEVASWERSLAEVTESWKLLQVIEAKSAAGASLKKLDDGSVLAEGVLPDKDVYTLMGRSELTTITGIRLELLTDDSLPARGPGRRDNGNLLLNELTARAIVSQQAQQQPITQEGSNDVSVPPEATGEYEIRLELQNPRASFSEDGRSVEMAIDGNPNTGWGIHPQTGRSHQATFALKKPQKVSSEMKLRFELHQIHGKGHLIGRLRLWLTSRPESLSDEIPPPAVSEILALQPDQRNEDQRRQLAAYVIERRIDRELAELPKQDFVYCGTNLFKAEGSFRPAKTPRVVHVLNRGNITEPGVEARPGALACVPGMRREFLIEDLNQEGLRRAELARWLSDPRCGLTWRSIVNRLWHYHFGRGLVATPDDFGHMGVKPTHPELLDWLAITLQDSGGSLKSLHRLMVTSAVYQQSSLHRADCAAVDAENQLLWRMNRRRLDAESIRDTILFHAGDLQTTMYGPSDKQFIQTPGVHVTPNVDYVNFDVDDPANKRRSVYRFIFRTLPDPFMEALDCPDASQLTPVRNESVTALQVLATMNDQLVVRECERMAQRLVASEPQLERQIDAVYVTLFGRSPTPEEASAAGSYARQFGLPNTVRVLFNANEVMFLD